jgi:hypothetical protein
VCGRYGKTRVVLRWDQTGCGTIYERKEEKKMNVGSKPANSGLMQTVMNSRRTSGVTLLEVIASNFGTVCVQRQRRSFKAASFQSLSKSLLFTVILSFNARLGY